MSYSFRFIILVASLQVLSCGSKDKSGSGAGSQTQKPAAVTVTWETLLRKPNFRAFGVAIEMLPDTSYVLAGSVQQLSAAENVYLLKLDKNGGVVWEKSYSKSVPVWANGLVPAFDGGFVIVCQSGPKDSARAGVYLMKVDAQGNYVWDRALPDDGENGCGDIARTLDSNYVVVGSFASVDKGQNATFLAKIDRNGSLLWKRTYPELGARGGTSVLAIPDGGFVVVASVTATSPSANENVLVLKTDANGNPQWHTSCGGDAYDTGTDIIRTADCGFAVTGLSFSALTQSDDVYFARLDAEGKIKWESTAGAAGKEGAYSIAETPDGGFVAAGLIRTLTKGYLQILLVKVDKDGKQLWERIYEAGDLQQARAVKVSLDGGLIVSAGAEKAHSSEWMAYIIKTDENGEVSLENRLPDSLKFLLSQ